MQFKQQIVSQIKEKIDVTSSDIRYGLFDDKLDNDTVELIDKWRSKNKNSPDKIQQLVSSQTSRAELKKIIQEIDPSFNDDECVKTLYLRNQSHALWGDFSLVKRLNYWIDNSQADDYKNAETILENLKCHKALKCNLQQQPQAPYLRTGRRNGFSPKELSDFDNELYEDFASGKTKDEINDEHGPVIDEENLPLFNDDNEFNAAKNEALYQGIWSDNQEVVKLRLLQIGNQLKKLSDSYSFEIQPFEAIFLSRQKKSPIGSIVNMKQSGRYKKIIDQLDELKDMNFAEAQSFNGLSINRLIYDINSIEDEINMGLIVCNERLKFIGQLSLEIEDRDLSAINDKAQRDQITELSERFNNLKTENAEQTKQLKKLRDELFEGADDAPSIRQRLHTALTMMKDNKKLSAQLNLHSHVVKIETFVKGDAQTEQDFQKEVLQNIQAIAQQPLPPQNRQAGLKINDPLENSSFKYAKQQDVAEVRAYFCESFHKAKDQKGVEVDVKGVAAFTERRDWDGSRTYKQVIFDEKNLQAKVNMILDLCFQARASAGFATGFGHEKLEGYERQPRHPMILTTNNIQDAALYFIILTKVYGLNKQSFICNIPTAQIEEYYDQNETAIRDALKIAAAKEKHDAWKNFAERDERINNVKDTASLFSKTADYARQERNNIQQAISRCATLLKP